MSRSALTLLVSALSILLTVDSAVGNEASAVARLSVGVLETQGGTPLSVLFDGTKTNLDGTSSIAELRSASEKRDPVAEALLGYLLLHEKRVPQDVEQGLRLLQRSADQGFDHAMAELGGIYLNGTFVPADYGKALRWLRLAADKHEPDAERNLGACYQEGLGVETNYTMAATWYRLAAEQTNYAAMKNLGVLHMKGLGVPKDYEAAKLWLLPAAEKGNNPRAMYDLGILADNGAMGTNKLAEAFKWYQRSADLDEPLGCWQLAICYRYGKSVPINQARYIFWAERAAIRSNPEAQFYLGEAFRMGEGILTNRELAMTWYGRAATNNYPEALYNLALGYLEDHTNRAAQMEANRCMLRAAQLQHREAQFQYAMSCMLGKNMTQDYEQALLWLKRSAEDGWPKAEYLLALANLNGTVLFSGKNQAEGIKWLRRAAHHGDLKSQWVLALKLIKGEELPRNQAEALKWFRWSADHGSPEAQNCLGYALETSEAAAPDLTEVGMWYQLASNQGQSNAKVNLGRLFSRLGEEQQQRVARRVQDFRVLSMPQLNPVKRYDDAGTPSLDMSSPQ